jgi:DNA-binding NarL/FixJ family response regulator
MARAPDGLPSSTHGTASRGLRSRGSSHDCPSSVPSAPEGGAPSAARIVFVNGHHAALPGLRDILAQDSKYATVITSAGADQVILALRQSPPELVVFLKGPPAAMLISLLSKALASEPSSATDGVRRQSPGAIFRDGREALSVREREVAKLAAAGARNKEIAWQLGISEGTVKLHLFRVYRKMGVTNRVGLALALGGLPKNPEPGSK